MRKHRWWLIHWSHTIIFEWLWTKFKPKNYKSSLSEKMDASLQSFGCVDFTLSNTCTVLLTEPPETPLSIPRWRQSSVVTIWTVVMSSLMETTCWRSMTLTSSKGRDLSVAWGLDSVCRSWTKWKNKCARFPKVKSCCVSHVSSLQS